MVHAGSGRDVLETGVRHVHDEGTAVDGGPLEVEKIVDPVDAPFDRALEKDAEDLGGDMRVGERPVPPEAGDTELGGDGVERATAKAREEPARRTKRGDDGGIEQ